MSTTGAFVADCDTQTKGTASLHAPKNTPGKRKSPLFGHSKNDRLTPSASRPVALFQRVQPSFPATFVAPDGLLQSDPLGPISSLSDYHAFAANRAPTSPMRCLIFIKRRPRYPSILRIWQAFHAVAASLLGASRPPSTIPVSAADSLYYPSFANTNSTLAGKHVTPAACSTTFWHVPACSKPQPRTVLRRQTRRRRPLSVETGSHPYDRLRHVRVGLQKLAAVELRVTQLPTHRNLSPPTVLCNEVELRLRQDPILESERIGKANCRMTNIAGPHMKLIKD